MAHTCSECTYLKIDGDTKDGKYWCDCKYEWKFADEQECWRYCTAYSRSEEVAKSAREYSKNQQSSGCYITTALCQILSMSDDNQFLMILRSFRNNYLQKTDDGLKLLIKYDIIGPEISEYLKNDAGKFNLSYILFNNYILKAVEAILDNENEKAKNIYTEMTNKLIKLYNIDDNINIDINEVEPSLSGHGRLVRKLKVS